MERSPGGRDLGEPALDRGVDVFVRRPELERALVELALDPAKPALDRRRLRPRKQTRRRQTSCVRDAARDVVRVELVIELERGSKTLQLGQHRPGEAPAPKLVALSPQGRGLG